MTDSGPARPVRWEPLPDGVRLTCRGLSIKAFWAAPGVLRVGSRPEADGPPVLAAGPMLNPDRKCTNEPFSLGEKDGDLVMTDGSVILTVELATGRLSYHGPDRQLLFRELSADAVHFERRAPTGPTEPSPGYRTRLGFQLTEPRAMASLRNLAIGLLKILGADNIAKTTRAIRDQPERALPLPGITNKLDPYGT